jgi:ABC-2 type transport system permease protein
MLKFAFICRRNTFRAMDVFFWPVMDLLVWGFLSVYMLKVSSAVPALITMLIGATIMWNVLMRAQQLISVSFLDDLWSRNLLNIFAAPIRVSEYVTAAYIMGFIQSAVVVLLLGGLAYVFYSFNLFAIGLPLAFLFANLLLTGWSLGLFTTALIMRWGPPAEAMAWAVPFLVQPVSAVFYPVSVLPGWLQVIAQWVPAAHVFEGMRQVLQHGRMDAYHMWCAFGLNVLYMIIAGLIFKHLFQQARQRGYLAKYGT